MRFIKNIGTTNGGRTPVHVCHFDNVREPAEVEPTLEGNRWQRQETIDRDRSFTARRCARWLGAPSYDAALDRLAHGWPEALDRIDEMTAELTKDVRLPRAEKPRRRAVRKAQGDELDIHAVRSGNLDRAWRTTEKTPKQVRTRHVVLVIDMAAQADQSGEAMFWSPAVALALVELLRQRKVSVEIEAVNSVEYYGTCHHITRIPFMRRGQRLVRSMQALLAFPAMNRITMFRAKEAAPIACPVGYGMPTEIPKAYLDWRRKNDDKTVTIAVNRVYHKSAAIRQINDIIASFKDAETV